MIQNLLHKRNTLGVYIAVILWAYLTIQMISKSLVWKQKTPKINEEFNIIDRKLNSKLSISKDYPNLHQRRIPSNPSIQTSICSNLPNALIIGSKKSGTTALKEMLNLHSKIQVFGQIHFFDKNQNYYKGLNWYKSKFKRASCNVSILLEKTPAYFTSREAAERVSSMNHSIKLILILRNPTTRLISDYVHSKLVGEIGNNVTFRDAVFDSLGNVSNRSKLIDESIYTKHVSCWLNFFSRKDLHIVDGEEFIKSPWVELEKVENFLGIQRELKKEIFYYNSSLGFYCLVKVEKDTECVNEGQTGVLQKGRSHPDIPENETKLLNRYFYTKNKDLYRLIGRNLSFLPRILENI